MTLVLDCGHIATVPLNPHIKAGAWLSCWALMYPDQGCQTQRKVIEVTP
jgi:hypothetical protein